MATVDGILGHTLVHHDRYKERVNHTDGSTHAGAESSLRLAFFLSGHLAVGVRVIIVPNPFYVLPATGCFTLDFGGSIIPAARI